MTVSHTLLLMTLTILRHTHQVYCRRHLCWNLSGDVFLVFRLWSWVFERKITEVKCRVHHIISSVHVIKMIYDSWCWPRSAGWCSVCQISPQSRCFLPAYPHCHLWREVSMHSPHSKSGELYSTSLRVEHLHKLFGSFLHRFVSSPPLLMHSLIYFSVKQCSDPQSFWHQGLFLWKTVFPWTGVGGMVLGWIRLIQFIVLRIICICSHSPVLASPSQLYLGSSVDFHKEHET